MANNPDDFDGFSVGAAPATGAAPDQGQPAADDFDGFSVGKPKQESVPKEEAAKKSNETTADQPADNTDYANMGWGNVALKAAKKAPESLVKTAEGIGSTIIHPIDTLNSFGNIGSGLLSKAKGVLGYEQDPEEKAKTEALVNAIGQHYSDVYGGLASGDTSGLKKELVNDPMSPLMDAATVLSGGDMALAKAPGMLGKVGALSGKLASAIDPVQNALRIAKVAAKPVTWAGSKVIPAAQAVTTGVERPYLKMAAAAGASDDPVVKTAFMNAVKKKSDPLDIVDAVNGAVATKKKLASQEFDKIASSIGMNGTGAGAPDLDWSGVNAALADQKKKLFTTDPTTGMSLPSDPQAAKHFGDLENLVSSLQSQPNGSIFHKIPGFNQLKKNIGNMKYGVDGTIKNISPETNSLLSSVGSAVKDAIVAKHPEYAELMDDWGEHADELANIQKAFGRGDKLSGMQQLNKLMIQSRKSDGQSMIQDLSQYDKRIPYMIAGHTMSDWLPNRLRTAIESPFAVLAALHNPSLLPGFAATSPRLAGNLNYLAGKASKIPNKLNLNRGLALEQGSRATQGYAKGGSINENLAKWHEGSHPLTKNHDNSPKTLYHGTDKEFSSFNSTRGGEFGPGNYFTDSPEEAQEYADIQHSQPHKPKVMKVHLHSKKPLVISDTSEFWKRFPGKDDEESVHKFLASGHDSIVYRRPHKVFDPDAEELVDTGKHVTHYVVHNPRQIKSAEKNSGNYDQNDPDITKAQGGRVGRKSGGSVIDPEKEADRLIAEVEKARKGHGKITQPLMNLPDEAITKALAIANESI